MWRFEQLAGVKVAIIPSTGANTNNKAIAKKIANVKDNDDAFAVMNLSIITSRFNEWVRHLPRIHPYYAVKCNNDPVLLKALSLLGANFDCASKAEINQLLDEGIIASGERIIYANPCKTRSYIQHADAKGIKRMTFDSAEELKKIIEHHTSPELILRIASSDPTAKCPLNVKFGCAPGGEARRLLEMAHQLHVPVIGISFHVGSGANDPSAFTQAIASARALFDYAELIGMQRMHLLDIGGGFPGYDTPTLTFHSIAGVINAALDEHFPLSEGIDLVAEPGRFFGTSPVSLVVNVIATKAVPPIEEDNASSFFYYVNDGVYGSFNGIFFDHSIPKGEPLFDCDANAKLLHASRIWGPTCDSLDEIEALAYLPKLSVGDWLFYDNMGAYSSVAASSFNGFSKPKTCYVVGEDEWEKYFEGAD